MPDKNIRAVDRNIASYH